VSDTQTVSLDAGSLGTDSTSVTLGGSNSTNVTLSVGTDSGDAAEYTATVASADDTATTNVRINEASSFDVTITSIDSAVAGGETLTVNATVTNNGDETGTQMIDLTIDGTVVDSTNETLGGGQSTGITLQWATGVGDAGNYTAAVASENDTDSTGVTVNKPANFTVMIDSTDSPVTKGETLNINATVTNTGEVPGTQTLKLTIDGTVVDSTNETLNSGQSSQVTFQWITGDGDTGNHTASVSSENNSDSTGVTVNEPANFNVAIASTNSPVTEGDTLSVNATVANTGDKTGSQRINFTIDGVVVDSTNETLDGGQSTKVTLRWVTDGNDTGTHTATVESKDNSDQTDMTVDKPPEAMFEVTINSTNSPILEGETLTVNATVQNRGNVTDNRTIVLSIGSINRDTTTVTLNPTESETIRFEWMTAEGDIGNYTATASGVDNTDSINVTVENKPSVSDYTNESGIVEMSGLFDGINDWRGGIVDTRLLLDVIDAWRSDDPV
jgi:hypothetical protein